jgi:hypothetical protein
VEHDRASHNASPENRGQTPKPKLSGSVVGSPPLARPSAMRAGVRFRKTPHSFLTTVGDAPMEAILGGPHRSSNRYLWRSWASFC